MLSPNLTKHIKRFGDYVIDLENIPQPIEGDIPVSKTVKGKKGYRWELIP